MAFAARERGLNAGAEQFDKDFRNWASRQNRLTSNKRHVSLNVAK
jgi:hypothetical protein